MFRRKNIISILVMEIATVFLAGCGFSSTEKTEINFSENSEKSITENIPTENSAVEEKTEDVDEENKNNSSEKEAVKKEEEEKTETSKKKEVKADFSIKDKIVNWGYQKSDGRKIDTIVIHSSYNSLGGDEHSLEKVLDIYKSYGVAPHYIISREGQVYRLVEDKNIAYHAGESKVPDGRTGVNNFSVGIEIINTKTESPSNAQYASLKNLVEYLKNRYKIKYTLGHSDIAPGRKDDPWKFDWKKVE